MDEESDDDFQVYITTENDLTQFDTNPYDDPTQSGCFSPTHTATTPVPSPSPSPSIDIHTVITPRISTEVTTSTSTSTTSTRGRSITATTSTSVPSLSVQPGVVPNMDGKSPVDFFRLLFDERVFNLIYEETTRYATQYLEKNKEYLESHPHARAHEWTKHPLKPKEIDAFFALVIGMGICGYPSIRYEFIFCT